ncbi:MAG: ubiquinol-cytochrome c reductase iron-sulfur subunit [Leptolyngbyaceae bacterium]|nr:ubiquinol-cytochrome c reductase iron-sulfur subunit [Leptolyngbyaceae bacterium]
MKRRELINWVGVGALASFLPVAIAACQSDTTSSPSTSDTAEADPPEVDSTPREDGFAAIGTVAALDEAGYISDKTFQGEQVLVIRDPADAAKVLAVNSLCTHQGCSVKWDDSGLLVCPCHRSAFNVDGTVSKGPAEKPLNSFEAKIEDDLVLVKV